MSWDALRDRDSGRPRRHDSRPSQAKNSVQPQNRGGSLNPRSRSLRAAEPSQKPADVVPAAIEEELWFGGHDASLAEDAAARSMAALVGRIVGAKPFPESARRLAELTRKDVIRIEPIVQVLERDPALSVRLLRLVNSAGYALRQRCTSVRHAATLVGTDRLHQIATTAAVLDLFDSKGSIAAKIVEHSTIVGAFCRYFGAHLALPVDDLFTAGFLHDIGKLMLLETEGDQYFALLEKYADRPDSIHVVERSLYGFDHAVLAAHVLTAWNIPDPVPKIVAWHHDPTRAYRVSSMMAALVQTVRLADVAVYAMVSGVEQEQFATLASTESANYLDISEPQLSSMWDELQTLYRESVEQCRGENAPALDPRSLRPKQPLSIGVHSETPRSTELPLQFPCVVCGRPTFGNKCSACGGHMCPEHQEGREDWCTLCARDFHNVSSEAPQAMSPRLAVAVAIATAFISTAIGYETGGVRGSVRAVAGTVLLLLLVVLLVVAGRRLMLRFRFVRNRPNRAVEMPQESDGGLKSLVPPTTDRNLISPLSLRDPLTEQLRMSGAAIDRVMIREVPSVPSVIAPKPFEGLAESHPSSSKRLVPAAFAVTTPVRSAVAPNLDDERLAMQGRSLVTLPVPSTGPAHHEVPEPKRNVHDDTRQSQPELPSESSAIRPNESVEIDSDARNSELGLDVLDAIPRSDPPLGFSPQTAEWTEMRPAETRNSAKQDAARSGTYPSSAPAPANADADVAPQTEADHGQSQHPLAALGLNPAKYSKRPTLRGLEPSVKLENAADVATPNPTAQVPERQTLVGISADEVRRALASPLPPSNLVPLESPVTLAESTPEPAQAETTVESPASPAPIATDPATSESGILEQAQADSSLGTETTDAAPALPEQSQTRVVEPLEAPTAEVNDAVLQPADSVGSGDTSVAASTTPETSTAASLPHVTSPQATQAQAPAEQTSPDTVGASLEQQVLAQMGPDFQAKVMDLVAEKVASIVAERMLESLGNSGGKASPPSASKTPRVRKVTPPRDATETAKTSRRKASR